MAYRPEFEVGDTLSRAASMFWRNLLPLGGCIALVNFGGVIVQLMASAIINGGRMAAGGTGGVGIDWVVTLLFTVATASFVSAVNGYAARIELQGEKPSFSGAWAAGWRNILPQMAVTALLWLMVLFGWAVLVVPGLILGVLFGLAPAAQVVEDKGVFAAFGDSLRASEGRRLALFGYYLIAYILFIVLLAILYGVTAALAFGGVMGAGLGQSETLPPVLLILFAVLVIPLYIFLIGALPLALGSITSAAYVALRRERADETLSKVFD
jgi:hypothetical protein